MNAELGPELDELVDAARRLPRAMIREVSDFAAFLGARIGENAECRSLTLESLPLP